GQYVNPENVKAYSAKTGVHFDESNFTSNEQLLTKLNTTKGQKTYDIIVPDADHVRIEKGLDLLMPLDHSLIPNLKNLAPPWSSRPRASPRSGSTIGRSRPMRPTRWPRTPGSTSSSSRR